MAGLLDLDFSDPQQAGLLALASGLLQAGAPQTRRVGIGEALAGGLGAMGQAQQNAVMMQRKKAADDLAMQMHQMQFGQMQQQIKDQEAAKQAMIDYANQRTQAAQPKPEQFRMDTPISDYQKSAQPNDLPSFYGNQPAPRLADSLPSNTLQAFSKSALIQPQIEELMNQYKFYSSVPKPEYQAKAQEAQMALSKLANELPKFSTDLRTVAGADGKPINVQMADDGTVRPIQGGYGVAPKFREINRGGITTVVNENTLGNSTDYQHVIDPSTAANVRLARDRMEMEKQTAANGAMLPDDTLKMMAAQYLAGDTSVMQNLGRGAQGAQNIIALRNEIANQAKAAGYGGADLAAKNAEYFGTKAGQRTVGTKTANVEMAANEAYSLIPLAKEASDNVVRSGFLPFGKAQIMFDDQTNDPNLRKFAAANNSLVNTYARAISPSGVPTVTDKEHAREMLRTAYDQKSYNATLEQMAKEIEAARASPKAVRQAFSDAVTGRDSHAPQKTVVRTGTLNGRKVVQYSDGSVDYGN